MYCLSSWWEVFELKGYIYETTGAWRKVRSWQRQNQPLTTSTVIRTGRNFSQMKSKPCLPAVTEIFSSLSCKCNASYKVWHVTNARLNSLEQTNALNFWKILFQEESLVAWCNTPMQPSLCFTLTRTVWRIIYCTWHDELTANMIFQLLTTKGTALQVQANWDETQISRSKARQRVVQAIWTTNKSAELQTSWIG